jgi:lipopolysaccharide export system permease protein
VRIAGLTAVIILSFADIFQIYLYYIPQIVIYTFPITYFIALVVSFYNFSKDGEILTLFILGYSPKRVALTYMIITFFISLALLFNSLIMMPLSKQASKNFVKIKKVESKIDIQSTKVGQNLGDWNIFAKEKDGNRYKDIVLFSNKFNENEQFIVASNALLSTKGNSILLTLYSGRSFTMGLDFIQTDFKRLQLAYRDTKDELEKKGIIQYWLDVKHSSYKSMWLSIYLLISFFPLFSLLLAFCIGIVNIRLQRRNIAFWISLVIVVYYGAIFNISSYYSLVGGVTFGLLFFMSSIYIFYRIIIQRY